jgi:hypothetical protein
LSIVCEILQGGDGFANQTDNEFMAWLPELDKMIRTEGFWHTNTPILDTWMWCFSRASGPSLWQTLVLASGRALRKDTTADNCAITWKAWANPKYPKSWPPHLIAPKDCEDPEKHNDLVGTSCRTRFEKIENGSISGDRAIFKVSSSFFGAAPIGIAPGDVQMLS